MPFELWAKETQPDQLMPDWYEWRVKNWGTKWDVCEAEIDKEGIEYNEDLNNDEEYVPFAWFSFRCWTAWGPPVPVWDRLHAMGIEVEANYQDEGGMFEGAYRDGEDKSWTPEPEEEAV
jgi:hypothetical protein